MTPRKGQVLRVFEKMALRKIVGLRERRSDRGAKNSA
jgi:hypothetical protein